jgi:two-component system sensor histidine kinase KdpD
MDLLNNGCASHDFDSGETFKVGEFTFFEQMFSVAQRFLVSRQASLTEEGDVSKTTVAVREYLWAAGTVVVVASACWVALPLTGYMVSALVFLLAVVLGGLRWSRGVVLAMAAASALLWNFLFIPPQFTLHIAKPEDGIMFGMFFMVALSMGHLTSRLRAREISLGRRQREAEALLRVVQSVALSPGSNDGFESAVSAMKAVIGADIAVILRNEENALIRNLHAASRFTPSDEDWKAVRWCHEKGRAVGRFMGAFGDLPTSWLPMITGNTRIGVVGFLWQDEAHVDFTTKRMMEALSLHLALVFEKEQLLETKRRAEVVAESERLHRTLFDSVSHELKTPIAVIRAALDGIDHSNAFACEIATATVRLQRIVENFLEMTRIESRHLTVQKEWCDLNDVIASACASVEDALGGRAIDVRLPEDLPLLELDPRMFAQALCNILHNACLYSPEISCIELSAKLECGALEVSIRDHGQGLCTGLEERIFEKFYRAPGSPAGGTGLGLAITHGFVEAQGGAVSARNHPEGGAQFRIRIPVKTHPV